MNATEIKDLSVSQLKKFLDGQSKEEISELILALYKSTPMVKQALNLKLNPNYGEKMLGEAITKVDKIFFPNTKSGIPYNFMLKEVKSIVKDFKNVCENEKLVARLQLHLVANLINFTNDFGDMDKAFYNTLESNFFSATKVICSHYDMYDEYFKTLEDLCNQTVDVGWGMYDALSEILDENRHFV